LECAFRGEIRTVRQEGTTLRKTKGHQMMALFIEMYAFRQSWESRNSWRLRADAEFLRPQASRFLLEPFPVLGTLVPFEDLLPKPDGLGSHFNKLIFLYEFQRLFERQLPVGHKPQGLVGA
jgi:hypothetical protein